MKSNNKTTGGRKRKGAGGGRSDVDEEMPKGDARTLLGFTAVALGSNLFAEPMIRGQESRAKENEHEGRSKEAPAAAEANAEAATGSAEKQDESLSQESLQQDSQTEPLLFIQLAGLQLFITRSFFKFDSMLSMI